MKKRWKLDNKGMTLLEVIVAFAIFAIAAVILMSGFSIALRVMGNSNEIKEASQSNAGKLNVKDSGLEDLESVKNSDLSTVEGPLKIIQDADPANKKSFVIPGTFHIATSKDKTNMSLKLFEPDTEALITPSVPIPIEKPATKDKVPKVPVKEDKDAYWTPDDRLSSGNTFFANDGQFQDWNLKNEQWNKTEYIKNYGVLNKGVVTSQINLTTTAGETKSEYLQQLFFVAEEPFTASKTDGKVVYNVNFVYFGGSKMTMALRYNKDQSVVTQNTTSMKFNSFDTSKNFMILYLEQDMAITVNYYDDSSNDLYKTSIITLPKGYYELPNGTDLFKVAYDATEYARYTEPASVNSTSYQRKYEEIKQKLEDANVVLD